MKKKYYDFLCDIIGKSNKYSILLSILHEMPFYSLIPNDDNRGEDGKQLRENFINQGGLQSLSVSQIFTDDCSVLEMLIGLSFRLEFETMSSRWEKLPREWFWILIDNLGLSDYTDEMARNCTDEIYDKVRIFLDRRYKGNGEGGLFPLKRANKDQRRIEIWYQMNGYIIENYPM